MLSAYMTVQSKLDEHCACGKSGLPAAACLGQVKSLQHASMHGMSFKYVTALSTLIVNHALPALVLLRDKVGCSDRLSRLAGMPLKQ